MSHNVLSIRFFHKTVGDGCVNRNTRMLFTRSSAQPDTDVHCGVASGAGAVPPARRGRRPRRILGETTASGKKCLKIEPTWRLAFGADVLGALRAQGLVPGVEVPVLPGMPTAPAPRG